MTPFIDRMIRAAKLDVQLYEEVEADTTSLRQAMAVVLLASVAAGIGFIHEGGLIGLLIGTVGALLGWYIWAFLTYLIGTKILPKPQTSADHGQLLRTIGFSSAPGMIRIFGLIPGMGVLVNLLAGLWMFIAMVIAVRQALDYRSPYRAVGVCAIGWIAQALVLALLLTRQSIRFTFSAKTSHFILIL